MLPEYAKWDTFKKQVESKTFPMLGDLKDENGKNLEESYKYSQNVLENKFKKENIEFNNMNNTYERVSLLNFFYSTQMRPEQAVAIAEYIHNKSDIHEKILSEEGIDVLNEFIQDTQDLRDKGELKQVPYSFITKYCALYSYYNIGKSLYPIYDSYVLHALQDEFKPTYVNDPNDAIKDIVSKFLEKHQLDRVNADKLHRKMHPYTKIKTLDNLPKIDRHKLFFELMGQIQEKLNVEYRTLDIFLWRRGREISQQITDKYKILYPNPKNSKNKPTQN